MEADNQVKYNRQLYNDIIEWDVETWKIALHFWDNVLGGGISGLKALEIGARNGGLTLYLALKGCNTVCSDLAGVTEEAKVLHKRYKVEHLVSYAKVDATDIRYPNNCFDIVAFKSVLGGIGRNDNKSAQQKAINEIYRILKPNGLFLFAKNLIGSRFHMLLRKKFIRWGSSWRYVSIREMEEFTSMLSFFKYSTSGFCSAFGRTEMHRKILHIFDIIIVPVISNSYRYIIYGCARK